LYIINRNSELGQLERPLSREELEQHVAELTARAANMPSFIIVNTKAELPFDAPDDAKGAFHDGKIFLVAESITSTEDAHGVIFHEFTGHFGLRGFFGPALDKALLDIHEHNPLVKKYAAQWKADNADLQQQSGMTDEEYYYRSIEEAMAKMAQENKPFTFADRLLSTIQSLLRKIGMNNLADSLEAKTNAEALTMLHKAGLYIRKGMTKDTANIPEPLYPFLIEAKQPIFAVGQKLRETDVPIDDVKPAELDVKGTNKDILTRVAEEYRSWPEKITAADGSEILLANPEEGYISKRALHLVWDNEKDMIKIDKARWLPNVPTTLTTASIRLADHKTGNRVFVKSYSNGTRHMVVVAPDGVVLEQKPFTGRLVTQFPSTTGARREGMIIDWERENGEGRSQGNPNPTSPASASPGSRQGTFQKENIISDENVKGKEAATLIDPDTKLSVEEAQTETPAFKKWFGNSKVVDENGAPLVVYHGTRQDFSTFKRKSLARDIGFHFGNAAQANEKTWGNRNFRLSQEGGSIMPVYLKIENPIYLHADTGTWGWRSLGRALLEAEYLTTAEWDKIRATGVKSNVQGNTALRKTLQRKGYDGIIYQNEHEIPGRVEMLARREKQGYTEDKQLDAEAQEAFGMPFAELNNEERQDLWDIIEDKFKKEEPQTSYMVFEANQIKSATGNRGTFSSASKDITLSIEAAEAKAFAKQLDDYQAGKLRKDIALTVGKTPYVLERLGAKQLPVVISQDAIRKDTKDKHSLSIELLKELPYQLNDPIMVFASKGQNPEGPFKSFVVMTELQHEGKTVIAAIHLGVTEKHHIVNEIASVYGKDSDHWFYEQVEEKRLLYMNRKKSREWFLTRGLYLPKVETAIRGLKRKILFDYDLVKGKDKLSAESQTEPARVLGEAQLEELTEKLKTHSTDQSLYPATYHARKISTTKAVGKNVKTDLHFIKNML